MHVVLPSWALALLSEPSSRHLQQKEDGRTPWVSCWPGTAILPIWEAPLEFPFSWRSHLNEDHFWSQPAPRLNHLSHPWAVVHLSHTSWHLPNVAINPRMTATTWRLIVSLTVTADHLEPKAPNLLLFSFYILARQVQTALLVPLIRTRKARTKLCYVTLLTYANREWRGYNKTKEFWLPVQFCLEIRFSWSQWGAVGSLIFTTNTIEND